MQDNDQSFFSVPMEFEVLLDLIDENALWLDDDKLEQAMPDAFRLMTQVADLESRCLPLLKGLEENAKALADYLTLQSQKIDLVLHHHLSQDHRNHQKAGGVSFGGSGVSIRLVTPLEQGQGVAMRVFIPEQQVAIYAHGEVQQLHQGEHGTVADISFTSIREVDQDRLVRASLHVQQKLLRERAQRHRQTGPNSESLSTDNS